MCFGGGGGDGGAAEARAHEEARQEKIRAGSAKVAEIFGGPYNYEEEVWTPTGRNQAGMPIIPEGGAQPSRFEQINNAGPQSLLWAFPYGQNYGGRGLGSANSFAAGPNKRVNPDTGEVEQRSTAMRSGVHEGQFTDDYYDGVARAFVDYYMPQAQEQYKDAQRLIAFHPGGTRSSAYGRKAGKLGQEFERAKGNISERSQAAAAARRGEVEDNRSRIMAAVRAGAGASEAAASAAAASKALQRPNVYEPIGDLFSRVVNQSANATIADNEGYGRSAMSMNNFFKPSGKSSVTTVG